MAEQSLNFVDHGHGGKYTNSYLVLDDASLDLLKSVDIANDDWEQAFVCLICVDNDAENWFYKKNPENGDHGKHFSGEHKSEFANGTKPAERTVTEMQALEKKINSCFRPANDVESASSQEDLGGEGEGIEAELGNSPEPIVVVQQTRGNYTMVEIKQVGSNVTKFRNVFLKGNVPCLQDLGEKAGAATLDGVVLQSHHDWVTDVPCRVIAEFVLSTSWFKQALEWSVGPKGNGKVYDAQGGFEAFYHFLDAYVHAVAQTNPDEDEAQDASENAARKVNEKDAKEALSMFRRFARLHSDPSWSLVFFGLVAPVFDLKAQWDSENGQMNVLACEPGSPCENALFKHLQNGLRETATHFTKTNVMATLCNPFSCHYASAVENVTLSLLVDLYKEFKPQLKEFPSKYYEDIETEVETWAKLERTSPVNLKRAIQAFESADQDKFWQKNELHCRVRHMSRTATLLRASDEMSKMYERASRVPMALSDLAVFKKSFLVSLNFCYKLISTNAFFVFKARWR